MLVAFGLAYAFLKVWFLSKLWYTRFDVVKPLGLYLRRFKLYRSDYKRLFIHWIRLPDGDRHMHNHPWPDSWSLILWGGYEEERSDGRPRKYGIGDVSRFYPHTYHRITKVKPFTITLFCAGPRTRDWGFLVPVGPGREMHVDHFTYLGIPPGTKENDD